MALDKQTTDRLGDELFEAYCERRTLAPLTEREPSIGIDDAYQVSLRMVNRRLQDNGEKIIGKKIGVTSKAVQNMLGVYQPDFGFLTDKMLYDNGAEMPISQGLIQPRAEGELAFLLKKDLIGPGITNEDVIAATEAVMPCFEIVDSRIRDWKVKIQDTIADNASCGWFNLGDARVDPREVDFIYAGMVVEKNGDIISTGCAAAALGSPLNAVSWLANTLGAYGIELNAGDIILSGSLVPLEPVVAGDIMRVSVGGIGEASVKFT